MYDFGLANPGYSYIWFNGDTPGRHITIFTANDMPSNAVMIDVGMGTNEYPGSITPGSGNTITGISTKIGSINSAGGQPPKAQKIG